MSQLNHNQNNNNGAGNSNYHPKRPINRVQPQYAAGYGQNYISEYGYTGVYPNAAQGYYQQNPNTYYQHAYVPTNNIYADHSHHAIQLTTQGGEPVDLKGLKTTPKSNHVAISRPPVTITPKSSNATLNTHQRTPSTTTAASADPKSQTLKDSFKAAVLARAKAKAEAAEAANSKAATPEPATAKSAEPEAQEKAVPKTEEPKTEEPKAEQKAEPKAELIAEPVEEQPKAEESKPVEQKVEEQKVEEPKVEEPKAEELKSEEPKVEEPKVEEPKVEEPKAEEPKAEEPKVEETPKVVEAPKEPTPVPESKDEPVVEESPKEVVEESKPEAEAEPTQTEDIKEEAEPADQSSISAFLNRVSKAESIKDPFTFKYPEGVQNPNSGLKETSKVAIRYDPIFLVQFIDKTRFSLDDEFKQSISFLLDNLVDKGRGSGNFRGGFGQGSIQGIQGSQFSKSSSNLRKFNNIDSRSNSRQSSRRKGGSGRGDRKSNRNRGDREDREPAEPAEPVKPLEKSASRWVPKSRANAVTEVKYAPDGVTPLLSEEEINRKTKSLLNKLTLEFFDEITNEIIAIANQSQWEDDAETLRLVLAGIFDKATDEPHWSGMYAQLCAKLCKDISPDVKNTETGDNGGKLARKLLLNKCQQEYEKGWTENLPTNEDGSALEPEMMTDEYYRIAGAKRRGLGLVRLIGHLFVLRLLSSKVVNACFVKLTEDIDTPSEDLVENLIQLLKTSGKAIDADEGGRAVLDGVFSKVIYMSEKAKIPSRLQFALVDLVDLRKRRWEGGEAEKGPKTITQIHEEEERKQLENQRARNERSKQKGGDSRQNSSRNSTWGNNRVSASDMKSVGKISSPRSSSDLGPQNNFLKARSRSNKFTSPTPEAPKPASPLGARENSKRAPSNSFSLLHDHNDDEDEDEDEEEEEEAEVESEAKEQEEQEQDDEFTDAQETGDLETKEH